MLIPCWPRTESMYFLSSLKRGSFGLMQLSFYSQFNLTKQGKHKISVCLGTACYVKGAQAIVEALQQHLDIEVGGISEDEMFSLEATRCLGCCSLAPVMMIDDDVYAKLYDTKQIPEILDKYYLESELEEEMESEVDA